MNEYYECKNCGQTVQGFVASQQIECCESPSFTPVDGPGEGQGRQEIKRQGALHLDRLTRYEVVSPLGRETFATRAGAEQKFKRLASAFSWSHE